MDITWLFWLFFQLAFYFFIFILALYIGRELIVYHNLSFFKKQGVKCIYIPIIGVFGLMLKKKGQHDQMAEMKKVFEDNKNEPLFMMNSSKMTKSTGYLLDEALIKEFFVKEIECAKKVELIRHLNLGIFFTNGQKVTDARSAYGKLFNYDNLKKMLVPINKIIVERLKNFSESKLSKTEYTQVNIKDLMNEVICDIINSILFGEDEHHTFEGKDLPAAIEDMVHEFFHISSDPINALAFDYLHNFLLFPRSRRLLEKGKRLEDKCWEIYQKRLREGPKCFSNVLDVLIEKNAEMRAEGRPEMTKKEITGQIIMMQFAGSDTSLETTASSMILMARDQSVQENLRHVVDNAIGSKPKDAILTYEELDASAELDQYCNEFLRLGAPAPSTTPREFIKPTKLGNYNFRVGDRILVPVALMHTFSKYNESPYEFKPSRFTKENQAKTSRAAFIPFSLGRRNCVGKALGELLVKTLLVHCVRFFDVRADPAHTETKFVGLVYGYENPSVLMRAL